MTSYLQPGTSSSTRWVPSVPVNCLRPAPPVLSRTSCCEPDVRSSAPADPGLSVTSGWPNVQRPPGTRRGAGRARPRRSPTPRAGSNDAAAGRGDPVGRGRACSQRRRRDRRGPGGRSARGSSQSYVGRKPVAQITAAKPRRSSSVGTWVRTVGLGLVAGPTRSAMSCSSTHSSMRRRSLACFRSALATRLPSPPEQKAVVPRIAMRRPTSWTPRPCREGRSTSRLSSLPTTCTDA